MPAYIKKLSPNSSNGVKQTVSKIFSDYLETKGQRKTKERFAILHEIYSRNDHFDAENLFKNFKRKYFGISRATVYNTLDLLVECDLIKKHQFGNLQAKYEKSYGFKQHDHLICLDCQHVFEFCDPRIHQIQSMAGAMLNFDISYHSLTLFGKCKELGRSKHCKNYHGNRGNKGIRE